MNVDLLEDSGVWRPMPVRVFAHCSVRIFANTSVHMFGH